jgi:hypothetical protein
MPFAKHLPAGNNRYITVNTINHAVYSTVSTLLPSLCMSLPRLLGGALGSDDPRTSPLSQIPICARMGEKV